MTRLLDPPALKQSIVVLACDACGAEAHATCSCGKPYRPKAAERAAEALAAHPEKSDRALAAVAGTSPTTVGKVRANSCPDGHLDGAEGKRTGQDGKSYPARRRYVPPPPAEIRHDLIYQAFEPIAKMDTATLNEYERLYAERRSEFGFNGF